VRQTFAVILLLAVGSAQAVPVNWTLQNVVFDDGATLSGSFVLDVDSDAVVTQVWHPIEVYIQPFYFDVNIVTSSSTDPTSDFDVLYTPTYEKAYIGPYLQTVYDLDTGEMLPQPQANADPSSYQNGLQVSSEYQDLLAYITYTLSLNFAAPLTNAGGIVDVSGYQTRQVLLNGGDSLLLFQRSIVSGTIVGVSAVPIPAAVWLFGSGLVALGWFRRRQS